MPLGKVCSRELPYLAITSSTQKTTGCEIYGSPSSQARGLNAAKLLDAVSYEDWGEKNSTPYATTFESLIPNLGIWIQGSGAAGHMS